MNTQQVRLANTSHVLVQQRGGSRSAHPSGFAIGEQLRSLSDVDLQTDEGVVSVSTGTIATVEENNSQQVVLNLGEGIGKFVLDMSTITQYFERASKNESASSRRNSLNENNPTTA